MDKKKRIKQIVALAVIAAVVILLAAMPVIAKNEPEEDGPKASILSGEAASGSIPVELIGGGQLAQEDGIEVSVPEEVKLKSFLVANGDTVAEGQAIASVDRVSVMQAIAQVQETLEYLSEEIEKAGQVTTKEDVTALAGGTVKLLYGAKGDSVQSVMLEHGALAVLSLDGLMAVDMETQSQVKSGEKVNVLLPDGKTVSGKVVKNLSGEMTVTVEDKNYDPGTAVEITDSEGNPIGNGRMYIYSPWNATAYAGTIDSVKVAVGDKLSAGKSLMVLKDVGYSATYRQLIGQRQEYEELMLKLFQMYQTENLVAPCDGVVTGIDKNSVQLLSANTQGASVELLANAPNGDDQTMYMNYLGKIALAASNGWALQVSPQAIPIADYKQLMDIEPDETTMTENVLLSQTDLPVFTLEEDTWVQVNRSTIRQGDVMLFAADPQGNLVWCVLLKRGSTSGDGQTPGGGQGGGQTPGGSGNGSFPNGGNFPSGGGSFGDLGGMTEEEVFELYGLTMAQVAQVTAQNIITLDITVDEQDMKHLSLGMTAQVKINALGGEKHTATITQLGTSGTSNGGSSKYTVQLTMDRAGEMLSGMNATATILLSSTQEVLTVPAAALVEQGNKTLIYTGYDEKSEELLNPVEVTVGASDGETVAILEGLSVGQTYYYAYYDTLEISNTPDFGGMGSFFGR